MLPIIIMDTSEYVELISARTLGSEILVVPDIAAWHKEYEERLFRYFRGWTYSKRSRDISSWIW